MMNIKALFVVHSIIALVFGVAFVLVPAQVASIYGATVTSGGIFIGRMFGSSLLTFAAILWLARDSQDSAARRALVLGFFITFIIGAIVAAQGVLTGVVNALGWGTVALYAVLALCYGYLYMRQTGPAEA
jgi:hypothetical protein